MQSAAPDCDLPSLTREGERGIDTIQGEFGGSAFSLFTQIFGRRKGRYAELIKKMFANLKFQFKRLHV